MSLFENPAYEWRETFFVLFDEKNRPTLERLRAAIATLSGHLQVVDAQASADGLFESFTVYSPDDFAAMDITCATGEEVAEQLPEMLRELKSNVSTAEERSQLKKLASSTARLDVFHFSQRQIEDVSSTDDEEFLDPGGLLALLELLGSLCKGIVVDPQTGAFLS